MEGSTARATKATDEEADLLQRSVKKMKQGRKQFTEGPLKLVQCNGDILLEDDDVQNKGTKSCKDTLVGGDGFDGKEDEELVPEKKKVLEDKLEEDAMEDFSGFSIEEEVKEGNKQCPIFIISKKEEKRTLIIKLLGRKIGFKVLATHLYQLWAGDGLLAIIDLMNDYFIVRFSASSDYEFAPTSGPWLLYDHYRTVKPWDPDFDPEEDSIDKVAVWIRLPELPIRFYDRKFLTFVGNRVGKTLKVDETTLEQAKGKYARICVLAVPRLPQLVSVLAVLHLPD